MLLCLIFTHIQLTIVVLQLIAAMGEENLLAKAQSHGISVCACDHNNFYIIFIIMCLETFIAHLYNGIPTRVQNLLLNDTSLLLSWHSPDALHTNGIIEEYYVQVINNDTGVQTSHVYTTEDTYLLINHLRPDSQYTFRVAAFAGERGQFSQPLTIRTSNGKLHVHIDVAIMA